MSAFGSVHRVQTPQPQMSIWLSTKASAPRWLFRVAKTCWASLTASGHSITATPLASSHPLTLRLAFAVSFGHNLIIWDSTVWEELQSTPLCLASRDSLLDSELNGVQLWIGMGGIELGEGEDFTDQLRPGLGSWRGEVLRLTSLGWEGGMIKLEAQSFMIQRAPRKSQESSGNLLFFLSAWDILTLEKSQKEISKLVAYLNIYI